MNYKQETLLPDSSFVREIYVRGNPSHEGQIELCVVCKSAVHILWWRRSSFADTPSGLEQGQKPSNVLQLFSAVIYEVKTFYIGRCRESRSACDNAFQILY